MARIAWGAVVACVGLSGCVVPSFPPARTPDLSKREVVFERLDELIVPGKTTKGEVLQQLGEPDFRSLGDRGMLYVWSDEQMGILVGVPLPIPLSVKPVQSKAILIRFGASEIVQSVAKSANDQNCFGTVGAEMLYCSGRPGEPVSWQRVIDNDYVDTTSGVLLAPDERVREVFFVAAYHVGEGWVDGAVVVSNQAIVFVDRAGPDTPFNRVLMTLPRRQISEVRTSEDDDAPTSTVAVILLADGRRVTVALGSLRTANARPPFDSVRTQRFVDAVRYLILDRR